MKNTAIEWADATFNPWEGCTKVGPGCDHCYAEAHMDKRLHRVRWGAGEPRVRTSPANWREPLKWNAECVAAGTRARVFCASLADVFDNEAPAEWRAALFALIACTPSLDWLLLTKRIGNVATMIEAPGMQKCGLPPNVWIGATVVNQAEADRDIPKLLAVPAAKRFLSIEPMLGPINVEPYVSPHYRDETWPPENPDGNTVDWLICGGESGPRARPMHPDWARSIRDQCVAARVPFFFKQHGAYVSVYDRDRDDPDWQRCAIVYRDHQPGRWMNLAGGQGFHGERVQWMQRVGKVAAGRLLDGRTWDEVPR